MSSVCSNCNKQTVAVMKLNNKFVCGDCYIAAKVPPEVTPIVNSEALPLYSGIDENDYYAKMAQ